MSCASCEEPEHLHLACPRIANMFRQLYRTRLTLSTLKRPHERTTDAHLCFFFIFACPIQAPCSTVRIRPHGVLYPWQHHGWMQSTLSAVVIIFPCPCPTRSARSSVHSANTSCCNSVIPSQLLRQTHAQTVPPAPM